MTLDVRDPGAEMARDNYIGGAWVPARSGATDEVVAPATGEALEAVASSGVCVFTTPD